VNKTTAVNWQSPEAEMKQEQGPLIGRNIQKIRKQMDLTLSVLSEKSGVSKAMLSQIEAEKANPTVATVWKIAQGLGIDINDLMKGGSEPPRIFTVVKKDSIMSLDTDSEGLHLKVLSPGSMVEDLEMYLLDFAPGGSLESSPHFPRTEEFLTVIRGKIRVTAGENVTDLETGDFITYHCDIDHSIENIGKDSAEVHMVVRFHRKHWH